MFIKVLILLLLASCQRGQEANLSHLKNVKEVSSAALRVLRSMNVETYEESLAQFITYTMLDSNDDTYTQLNFDMDIEGPSLRERFESHLGWHRNGLRLSNILIKPMEWLGIYDFSMELLEQSVLTITDSKGEFQCTVRHQKVADETFRIKVVKCDRDFYYRVSASPNMSAPLDKTIKLAGVDGIVSPVGRLLTESEIQELNGEGE